MQTLSGRRYLVQKLVFSRCGRWLAAGGYSGGVHVWDTSNPTAKPLRPNPEEILAADALAFRADGQLFFRYGQAWWYLFDPVEQKLTKLESRRGVAVIPSANAERAIEYGEEDKISVWSIRTKGKPEAEVTVKHKNTRFLTAAFASDGKIATAESRYVSGVGHSQVVAIRDAKTGKSLCEFPGPTHIDPPRIAFSHDSTHILASWMASVNCWNIAEPDKKPRKGVNPTRKHFLAMAVHPEGPLLTVDNGRMVRVWDVPAMTGDRMIEWNIGKLHAVAVSPDGTRAAVGSHTGKVLVWDWD